MRCPPNSDSLAHSSNIEACICDNRNVLVYANVITTTRCTGGCPCPASTGLGRGFITDGFNTVPATNLLCRFYIQSTANVSIQILSADVFTNQFGEGDYVEVVQSGNIVWNQRWSAPPSSVFTNSMSDDGQLYIQFARHDQDADQRPGFYAEWWTHGKDHEYACPLAWCDPGSFFRDGTCVACALDTISSMRGPELCEDCPRGKFSNLLRTQCTVCSHNSREPNFPDFAVDDCICNYGFEKGRNGVCTACAAGKYRPVANATCESCPRNTYQSERNSSSCIPCIEFSSSSEGSVSAMACECDTGYTLVASICTRCSSTEYADVNGICQACPSVYSAADITQAFESGTQITACLMLLYI